MRILLTGGAGFIGSHTCVELCNAGHDPVIVDNYINSCPEAIRRIEQIVGHPVPHYEADVADKAALDRIFSENDFDCVIHFAGLKAVGESVAQPLRYYRNNLDTTLTLCEVMQAHGVKRIVFSSSATVYGNQPVVPYREDMPSVGCTNPYGWTKFMIEKILEGQAAADPEWSVVLLRYFNPIGAHSSGLIGEDPSGIPNNLMPYIAKVAVGELEKLRTFLEETVQHMDSEFTMTSATDKHSEIAFNCGGKSMKPCKITISNLSLIKVTAASTNTGKTDDTDTKEDDSTSQTGINLCANAKNWSSWINEEEGASANVTKLDNGIKVSVDNS